MLAAGECISCIQYANVKQWIWTRRLSFGFQIWYNVNVCKWQCAHINGDRHIEIAANRIFVDFLQFFFVFCCCFILPTYAYVQTAHIAPIRIHSDINWMCLEMHGHMDETLPTNYTHRQSASNLYAPFSFHKRKFMHWNHQTTLMPIPFVRKGNAMPFRQHLLSQMKEEREEKTK